MYTFLFVASSTTVPKEGNPFTLYRVFYKDSVGHQFFANFYDRSPVVIGKEVFKFSDAVALLVPGSKFSIFDGDNSARIFNFEEV